MSAFDAAAFLAAWEDSIAGPSLYRAVRLLAAAWPERSADEWARCRMGVRDAALLDLQDEMFGPELETTADCPQCRARVELTFTTEQVRTRAASGSGADRVTVDRGGYSVVCRLPTSDDLLRLPQATVEEARQALLELCVEEAKQGKVGIRVDALPATVLEAVVTEMAQADPQAEVRVGIDCPDCGHRWSMDFDIARYVWTEVEDWARRMVNDVHSLARAYGWSERDVLAMSSHRRSLYLERLEG